MRNRFYRHIGEPVLINSTEKLNRYRKPVLVTEQPMYEPRSLAAWGNRAIELWLSRLDQPKRVLRKKLREHYKQRAKTERAQSCDQALKVAV